MSLIPLIGNPLSHTNQSGILPRFVENGIATCCRSCFGAKRSTIVNWNYDSSGLDALKNSKEELANAMAQLAHIALPFLEKAADLDDIKLTQPGSFDFVPVILSPGIAVFSKEANVTAKANSGAKSVFDGVVKNIPFYITSCLVTVIAGIIVWGLVSLPDHLTKNFVS